MTLLDKPKQSIIWIAVIIAIILGGMFLPTAVYSQTEDKEARLQRAEKEELERAAEKLYLEAEKLFMDGDYWESSRNLIILMDFYPSYSKIDQVVFTLGDCLFEIGLLDGSKKIFKFLVKKYIASPHLPRALLGLQRIEYDKGNLEKCIEFYKVITKGNPSRDILDASRYYAGLSYYNLFDYDKAIEILTEIDKGNPYSPYAQYTAALSYLRLRQVREAVNSLNSILRIPIVNDDFRNIVDETYLTLGYIYYELGYYQRALGNFRAVSSKHNHYKSALLAAGWAATKMKQYQLAVDPLTDLVSMPKEDENTQEGFFLLGRCYLKLGLYDEALKVYEYLVNSLPKRELVPMIVNEVESSIHIQERRLESIKMDLLVLETKLLNLIQLTPDTEAPDYLQLEKHEINQTRNELMKQIQTERQNFSSMLAEMDTMKKMIKVKEERQDWRAFAEYGKSRALFLKRTEIHN